MAISKKHYTQVADLFVKRFEMFRSYGNGMQNVPVVIAKREFSALVIGMADIFAADNKNFDRKVFYAECCRFTEDEQYHKDLKELEF